MEPMTSVPLAVISRDGGAARHIALAAERGGLSATPVSADDGLAEIHKGLTRTFHVCCRGLLGVATVLNALIHNGYPFSVDFVVSGARNTIANAKYLMHHADPVFVNATDYPPATAETPHTVIVTDGSRPVRLFRDGRLVASATPAAGVGDAFIGAFLAARAGGLSDSDALDLAARRLSRPR